jgi:neutral ceramidase
MFESTEIIGRNQYDFAKTLYDQAKEEVTGKVDYRLSYLDMPAVEVRHTYLSFPPPIPHHPPLVV